MIDYFNYDIIKIIVLSTIHISTPPSRPAGFRFAHSVRKASTGLAFAALQACTLTVNMVNTIDKIAAIINGHIGISIL